MKQFLFFSLFLVTLRDGCFAGEQQVRKTKVLAQGLTVQVPEGLTISSHRQAPDFELFVFKSGSNAILHVYLGNQPDFPKEKAAGPIQSQTVNGIKAESVTQKKPGGTISREVLLRLHDKGVWPQRMHCWYANLSEKQSSEAEQLLSSIRLVDKSRGKDP
jgi:hypothetical protein